MYALKNGTIGYHASGAYPNYTSPSACILNGSTSKYDWHGLLPTSHNLRLVDPEKGYIVTANSKGAPAGYLANIFDISFFTARSTRINKELRRMVKRGRITALDMWRLQEDTLDESCLRAKGHLARVLPELAQFDCDFRRESQLATLYELVLEHFVKALVGEQVARLIKPNFAYKKLGLLGGLAERVRKGVLGDSRRALPWGEFKQMYYPHAFKAIAPFDWLLSRRLPGRGTTDTVNVATSDFIGSGVAVNQANMRLVVSFGDEDSFWSTDTGQSGHFLSPHYFDLRG